MLKLDGEYYITSDERSFVLRRKYKASEPQNKKLKSRGETEITVGYYSDVMHAINRYRKEQMLKWVGSEKISLEQLCDRITELDATLKKKMRQLVEMEDKHDEGTEVGRVVVADATEKKRTKKTGGKKDD